MFLTIYYSNYSGNCKALLQYLNTLNIMEKLIIKFINIDDIVIRSIILKKFTQVPTMIIIDDEDISMLIGENVFNWFESFNQILKTEPDDKIREKLMEQEPEKDVSSKKTVMELADEIYKSRN